MGCNIHSYAEIYKDGKWQKVGDVFALDTMNATQELTRGRVFSRVSSASLSAFAVLLTEHASRITAKITLCVISRLLLED